MSFFFVLVVVYQQKINIIILSLLYSELILVLDGHAYLLNITNIIVHICMYISYMQCKIIFFVSSHQQIFDFDPQIWYDTLPRENMDEKANEVKNI